MTTPVDPNSSTRILLPNPWRNSQHQEYRSIIHPAKAILSNGDINLTNSQTWGGILTRGLELLSTIASQSVIMPSAADLVAWHEAYSISVGDIFAFDVYNATAFSQIIEPGPGGTGLPITIASLTELPVALIMTNVTPGMESYELITLDFTMAGVTSAVGTANADQSVIIGGPTGAIIIRGLVAGNGIILGNDIDSNITITKVPLTVIANDLSTAVEDGPTSSMNIIGTSGIITYGTGNTLTIDNLRDLSPYVVSPIAGDSEYTTVQAAYAAADAAGSGIIILKTGTYDVSGLVLSNPNVHIMSVQQQQDPLVILNGTMSAAGLNNVGSPVYISGVTLGSPGAIGYLINVGADCDITFMSVTFRNGGANPSAAIYAIGNNATVTISNSKARLTNNTGVALYSQILVSAQSASLTIEYSDIDLTTSNTATLINIDDDLTTAIFKFNTFSWTAANTPGTLTGYIHTKSRVNTQFYNDVFDNNVDLATMYMLWFDRPNNAVDSGDFLVSNSSFESSGYPVLVTNAKLRFDNNEVNTNRSAITILDSINVGGYVPVIVSNCGIIVTGNTFPAFPVTISSVFSRRLAIYNSNISTNTDATIAADNAAGGPDLDVLIFSTAVDCNNVPTAWASLTGGSVGQISYSAFTRFQASVASGPWTIIAVPNTP